MANRKDMRREELIVPYAEQEEAKKPSDDIQGTMSSALPMAAIFTRNKMIGWTAVMISIQNWLSETPAQAAASSTPGYMSIGLAVMSLGVAYMPLFLPPPANLGGSNTASTGTGAAAPVPPA